MATKPPTTPPKTVLDFYQVGKWLNDQGSDDPREHKPDLIKDMADKMGVAPSYVNKWRLFARLYNEQELAVLLALRQPNGHPLGISHVWELSEIKDKSLRAKIQSQAAAEEWSVGKLKNERFKLQGKNSRARKGGRPPKLQKNAQELKAELIERTDKWIRWYSASKDLLRKVWPKGKFFGSNKCSRRILKLAAKVDEQMQALAAALNPHG